jgi:hypothetical protein
LSDLVNSLLSNGRICLVWRGQAGKDQWATIPHGFSPIACQTPSRSDGTGRVLKMAKRRSFTDLTPSKRFNVSCTTLVSDFKVEKNTNEIMGL